MSHQIKISVGDDLHKVIKSYAKAHDCTIAYATAQICAIGAETIEGKPVKAVANQWGGKRESSED